VSPLLRRTTILFAQPPGFVKHGTAYVVDQYSVVSGLAAAVKWWGFVAFRVGIEPLIGWVNTRAFMDSFRTVDKLVQRQIRKTRRT
jgi:hypothetical protein